MAPALMIVLMLMMVQMMQLGETSEVTIEAQVLQCFADSVEYDEYGLGVHRDDKFISGSTQAGILIIL